MRNPKFLGVYSLKTASTTGQKPRFFVWFLPDGNYAIQELDASLSQRGPARAVSQSALEKGFKAEPAILAAPITTPDFRPLLAATRSAPQPSEPSPSKSIPGAADLQERTRRAKQLEADLRDSFAKALQALKRTRDRKAAVAMLGRIVRIREGIDFSHRHMFRDFGVALRKQSLPELALIAAQRAVALSPRDDHARFNLARILSLLGRYREAEAQLDTARKIDPEETVYDRLSTYLGKEQLKGESLSLDDKD